MLPQGHFWGETEALSVVCFCPAYWVKYKHQHIWGMKEILQACGFHCIMTLTAFSSSRGAHKKARVTPLHLCRSRPTLIPHPSEEGLFCTLGETIISFISFGHCCQSWQMRSWWETQLWPKSFIEISEISIKHPFFFFLVDLFLQHKQPDEEFKGMCENISGKLMSEQGGITMPQSECYLCTMKEAKNDTCQLRNVCCSKE